MARHTLILMFLVYLFHRSFAGQRKLEQIFDCRKTEALDFALSSTNGTFELLYIYISICHVSKDRLEVSAGVSIISIMRDPPNTVLQLAPMK